MTADEKQKDIERSGRLSIGALSRATGVPIDTLRTWERRYGFPVPERKPSGHRVYPLDSVVRLRRIAEALALGHRAGEVVPASAAELSALLAAMPGRAVPPLELLREPSASVDDELLEAVGSFDGDRLRELLLSEWAHLGPVAFLKRRITPLMHRVGEGWAVGDLSIRHEHFASERLDDLLRSLRLPFEERATGPVVVLATLPGEHHALGLHMAALVLALAGCRVVNAGVDLPTVETAALASELQARAVGISVSLSGRQAQTTADLRRLRKILPREVLLLVGGEGARPMTGAELIIDLEELEAWGRDLARRT